MKLLFVAFAILTFSASSFAKTYQCWADLNGYSGKDPGVQKFELDTTKAKENRVSLTTVTKAKQSISFTFTVLTVLEGDSAFMTMRNNEITSQTDIDERLNKGSTLAQTFRRKDSKNADYAAKMGCTLVKN